MPTHYDMRVTRLRYRHPLEPNFRRVVYQLLSPDSEASRVLVCYEWATEPHLLQKSLQHIQDNRPKITTSRVPTVSAANVYILETERDLVAEQQAQVGGFGWKVISAGDRRDPTADHPAPAQGPHSHRDADPQSLRRRLARGAHRRPAPSR